MKRLALAVLLCAACPAIAGNPQDAHDILIYAPDAFIKYSGMVDRDGWQPEVGDVLFDVNEIGHTNPLDGIFNSGMEEKEWHIYFYDINAQNTFQVHNWCYDYYYGTYLLLNFKCSLPLEQVPW